MTNANLERQKQTVRQWLTASENNDIETLRKITGPGFYQQTLSIMDWVRSTFSDHQVEIQEMIAEGNQVMVRAHSKGQHTGEFFGVPGTGRRWENNEGAMLFRFEDDVIVDVWSVWNIPLHLEKLGLKMSVSA